VYDNKARSRFELTFNGAPQAYVGEARGPRVHLCHKLFLRVSNEKCDREPNGGAKIAWSEA